jgi:hypothetical protein
MTINTSLRDFSKFYFGNYNGLYKAQIIQAKNGLPDENDPGDFDGIYSVIKFSKPFSIDGDYLIEKFLQNEYNNNDKKKTLNQKKIYDAIHNKNLMKNILVFSFQDDVVYTYNIQKCDYFILFYLIIYIIDTKEYNINEFNLITDYITGTYVVGVLLGYTNQDIYSWGANVSMVSKLSNIEKNMNGKLWTQLTKKQQTKYYKEAKNIYDIGYIEYINIILPKIYKLLNKIKKMKIFNKTKTMVKKNSYLLQDFLDNKITVKNAQIIN